jgi:pyrimidine operon attenuation protein/uracil phosphoribosyltransferase
MRNSYDEADVGHMIDRLVGSITSSFARPQPLNIVGIRTRGEALAGRLIAMLSERGN